MSDKFSDLVHYRGKLLTFKQGCQKWLAAGKNCRLLV